MRKFCNLAFFVLSFTSQLVCGQTQADQNRSKPTEASASAPTAQQKDFPRLKIQAGELAEAFSRQDFDKVASLTYPKLVELMGGRERMVAFLNQGVKQAEAENVTFLSNTVGQPEEIISVERQLFAVIPTTLKMRVPEGILTGQSFLIGVSKDQGENWTFVGGSGGVNREKLKVLFPAAADKLKLPELKPPVLQKEP